MGVIINDKKNCFKVNKEKAYNNSIKFTNQLYSILGTSCNRMLIGKTFYKGLVLPNIIYASDVILYSKHELNELQKTDNKAY